MKKKNIKKKFIYFLGLLTLGVFISYRTIKEKKIIINNKEIIDIVINNSFNEDNILKKIININKLDNELILLKNDYKEVVTKKKDEIEEPIIYLYNSHQTEEYQTSIIGDYSINPTVTMTDYILEDIFNKNGYKTYVEERSVKEVLNKNNWNYASSYKATRIFLEDIIKTHSSLKYFIDIHRDSLAKDRTTITINNRNYAKMIFLLGLENPKYNENLEFIEKINNKINEYYPGLSKGIYKKEGPGVNGVYNQDFSNRTILIEVGGYENTTNEVLNTAIAFSKCYLEVLNEENH